MEAPVTTFRGLREQGRNPFQVLVDEPLFISSMENTGLDVPTTTTPEPHPLIDPADSPTYIAATTTTAFTATSSGRARPSGGGGGPPAGGPGRGPGGGPGGPPARGPGGPGRGPGGPPPAYPNGGGLKGNPPDLFDGDRTKTETFDRQFLLW